MICRTGIVFNEHHQGSIPVGEKHRCWLQIEMSVSRELLNGFEMQQRVSACLQCLQVHVLEWEQQISCTVWLLFDGLERADHSCRCSCGCSHSALRSVPAFALLSSWVSAPKPCPAEEEDGLLHSGVLLEPQKGWCQVPPRVVCAGDGLRAAVLVWILALSAQTTFS